MARFGFVGGTYQLRNVRSEAQRCQNFYPEAVETGIGASPAQLSPTWGLATFANTGTGINVRGSIFTQGRLFMASDQFYEVFADGTQVAHGFLPSTDPTGSVPVVMVANNANQLLICAAGQLWLFPLASGSIIYTAVPVGVSQIRIVDNGGANLDYYFTPAAALPAWTAGTTLTISGTTNLSFLNNQTATFLDAFTGDIHAQFPRTLSQNFFAAITNISVSVASTTPGSSTLAPTTANQVASGSGVSWQNLNGAIGSTGAAQAAIPNTSATVYVDVLRGQAFNFALPANATIDGIAISFGLQVSATQFINGNVSAQLYKAGLAVGNAPSIVAPTSNSFQTVTFGSSSDTWGTSWSPGDINNAGFALGVKLSGQYQGTAGNQVVNGDFEFGPNTQPAPNWGTFLAGATWGYSAQFYTGSRSYGVIPTPGGGPFPAIQYDGSTLVVTPGQVLQLSGAILNTSLATQGSIYLQFYDASNNFLGQQGISNTTTVIANFVFLTAIVTVPANAAIMIPVLVNDNNTSACYYDAVQVVAGQLAQLQNYQVTVYWHSTGYNATVTFALSPSPFTTGSITFSGLTNVPALNGTTYAITSVSGNTVTIANVPASTYSGAETGGATGNIANYGPTADTGTVSGNVVSYNDNPVQVATNLGPFSWVGFLDGFFLGLLTPDAQTAQGKTMQYSALEDGTTWTDISGVDFYFRVLPFTDSVTGAIVNQRNIWLYGPKQSTVYWNTGDLLNPFQPIQGAFLEYGLAAQWSLAKLDNSVFWLGQDERGWAMAFRSSGWSEQRVSNHAVEQEWNDYADMSDAVAYSMQTDGHEFYHLYFPTANRSWRYDAATGMWHEPCFWAITQNVAHRSHNHVFAFSKHLLGDTQSGTLYVTNSTLVTDDVVGAPLNPISRMRRAPHITNELEWEFHHRLRVHLETGLGPMPPFTGGPDGLVVPALPVRFADIAYLPRRVVTYDLGIDASGNFFITPTPLPNSLSGYVQFLPLQTPDGLQSGLYVSFGQLITVDPQPAPREPQVMLRFSDDGGHSWSNEYICGAGMAGEWKRRVEFRRLGRSRDRIYEVRMTDPITWRLVDAYLDTTPTHKVVERYAKQLAKIA